MYAPALCRCGTREVIFWVIYFTFDCRFSFRIFEMFFSYVAVLPLLSPNKWLHKWLNKLKAIYLIIWKNNNTPWLTLLLHLLTLRILTFSVYYLTYCTYTRQITYFSCSGKTSRRACDEIKLDQLCIIYVGNILFHILQYFDCY